MKLLSRAALIHAIMFGMAMSIPATVMAKPFRIGVCYDLSKAYTFATPQVAQAAKDLAELVNRKGGIGGEQVIY